MPIPTISVTATETRPIGTDKDVVHLIGHVRQQAGRVGMTLLNQTKLITAASELARNMLNYAGGGEATVELVRREKQVGVRLIFADSGPGIADLTLAMRDDYSSGSGLGLGLPGARRLSSEFFIDTTVGKGTTVTIIKWTNA